MRWILPLLFCLHTTHARLGDRLALSNLTRESDGVYYSEIHIGDLSSPFRVIMDTGSSVLAIPSAACSSCGETHTRWNASLNYSTTPITIRYAEGSYIEYDEMDMDVHVDGVVLPTYPVGAIRNESKMFRRQDADGIFGLYGTFTDYVKAFSICFRTRTFDIGLPTDVHTWIPIASSFEFSLDLVSVAGLDARGMRALIDSGTTDIILPKRYVASRTRNGGLCSIQFKHAPPMIFDRCIPPEHIVAGTDDAFVFGTSFFKHVPRIVFTNTHIGWGSDPDCSPVIQTGYVPSWDEKRAAVGVIAAYVWSIWICYRTFFTI